MRTFRLAAGGTFPAQRTMISGGVSKAGGIDGYQMRAYVS
jgi:hypothetical protein